MPIFSILWILVCVAGLSLSLVSAKILGPASRATVIGWLATAAYFVIAAIDALRVSPAPFHVDYVALAVLTVAFVFAGIRDEPQAEPWFWPTQAGLTGAERRARRP